MPKTKFKFLQIGLGSMGKRRIRNLLFHKIDPADILGFDISPKRCAEVAKEYGIKTINDFNRAIKEFKPDAFIISTPPNLHEQYFLYAAKHKLHFFTEVPTTDRGYKELMPLLNKSFVAAPSCTFRYAPAIKKIKELLVSGAIGRPLTFNHYLGQYLPDWHPYEDYRKVYFSKKETGGAREMLPYELVWLSHIFGSLPIKATGISTKVSKLEMTADDLYCLTVQFKNGVIGNLMIDLLNRKASRTLRIIGTEGTLDWDWLNYRITVYRAGREKPQIVNVKTIKKFAHYNTTEDIYREEVKYFLEAIANKKPYPYTFKEDYQILKVYNILGKGEDNFRKIN